MTDAPQSVRASLRSLPRNVWATTLTSFFTDISTEMIVNLLPLYLANVLGVRTNVIGLIEGVADSTASILKVFSGWFSDKLRRRKGLTILGYSLSAFSKPFLYFAATWPGVLAVRFADRVGKGIRTAPRDALIADSVSSENRGLAFGVNRTGDTLGAFTGLAVALLVVLVTQAHSVGLARDTFQTIVLVSIVPAVLAVLVLALWARETPVTGTRAAPRLSLKEMPPAFRHFLLIVIIFTLGNSSDAFLILRAQERGLSVPAVLGMLMTFNLVYALLSGPAGALSDRIGRRRLIVIGWTVYGLIYIGFALVQAGWQVWALYGLYGIYYAAFDGTARAFVADFIPVEKRGTAYGIYNTAVGIVALPASLLAGILWQGVGGWAGFGPAAPFVAGAVLALVALVLLLRWQPGKSNSVTVS
ncbi:MAG: MFS transporter [Anaerolineae bacterium]